MSLCRLWVAALAMAIPAVAAAQPGPPAPGPVGMVLDRVVASVNDEAITLSELQEEGQPVIRKIFQDFIGSERERRTEEAQKRLLDDLIDRRLMYQVAKREGLLASQAEVQGAIDELKKNNNITDDAQFRAAIKAEGLTLEQVRRSIGERLSIGRLLSRQIRSTIILSEEELLKYYESHSDQFQRTGESRIRHLLVAVTPERDAARAKVRAEEALGKIRAGASFSATAVEYSDAPAGGDAELLTVHKGDLAPEIEAAAFNNPAGWLGEPIRTDAGWHLVQVVEVRAEGRAPFAEVREAIRDQLLQEKFDAKRKEWLVGLRGRSSIHVFAKEGELVGAPKTP